MFTSYDQFSASKAQFDEPSIELSTANVTVTITLLQKLTWFLLMSSADLLEGAMPRR